MPAFARLLPLAALVLGSAARADVCLEQWWSVGGGQTSGTPFALAVFDAGDGPRLYVGGASIRGSGAPYGALARWSGETWEAFAAPTSVSTTSWLGVLDSGDRSRLYAGGSFNLSGGPARGALARWGGQAWEEVAVVDEPNNNSSMNLLRVVDDGGGPALYAAGTFASINGVACRTVAKWTGAAWSAVGGGVGKVEPRTIIRDIAAFPPGTPSIHVAGVFAEANGGASRLNGLAVHEERCLCPDVDGSGAVDQGDLDELLFRFNQQSTADADGDGWVTQADLDLVLFTFGETCP